MFELNNIYCGDSYVLIKQIPDKSIDCIYIDAPYYYTGNGGGSSRIAQQITKMKKELQANNIYDGFNYEIFNDFVRIMKKDKLLYMVQ